MMEILKILAKECFRHKSLSRTLHNIYLNKKNFKGKGIDYGSKNGDSSYYRFINLNKDLMTYTDFHFPKNKKVISIDFEKKFKFKKKYNFAFVFNVLEHIYNYQQFMNSVNESLINGGLVEGVVPFIERYHADPNDYFRYTHSTLHIILKKANFKDIKITPIGLGMFQCAAHLTAKKFRFRVLILCIWLIAIALDTLLLRSKHQDRHKTFYTALAFSARKL